MGTQWEGESMSTYKAIHVVEVTVTDENNPMLICALLEWLREERANELIAVRRYILVKPGRFIGLFDPEDAERLVEWLQHQNVKEDPHG